MLSNKRVLWLGISSLLLLAGCDSGECVSGPSTQSLSRSTQALESFELAGDAPAARAFDDIQNKLARGEEFRMDIYQYELPGTVDEFKKETLSAHAEYHIDEDWRTAADEQWECAWNQNSYFEMCAVREQKNVQEVDEKDVRSNSFYIYNAMKYMDASFKSVSSQKYQFQPYKRKYGINATAPTDGSGRVKESVYEVGVSFAATLDGWPVIGPGGKAYVYMNPDGSLVSKSIYRKSPSKSLARLTQNDIKTPEEALEELKSVKDDDLTGYIVTRREFGYFAWGKNSIQNVIAPYYVFFFSPTDSDVDTVVYRIVTAVKGKYAELVQKDYELEVQRKKERMENDTELTPKK
ncbi:MAG: hypothetical protein IJM59_11075 [Proteobacteria bacterium]|nr:hypothetical protein [Pseudomonadota bacterium]